MTFCKAMAYASLYKLCGKTIDEQKADSVLEVSLTANEQIVQEMIGDDSMYESLMKIMEPHLLIWEEKMLDRNECKTLYDLVCDNLISMETAASRRNLTADEFCKKLQELDII